MIEGVGDHGCEYMTGGRVVILGPIGRNFAAGMSGGIAYVFDPTGQIRRNCNTAMVFLERIETDADVREVRNLIELHERYTGSTVAKEVLADWEHFVDNVVKVMPQDYKRVLEERMRYDEEREAKVRGVFTNG